MPYHKKRLIYALSPMVQKERETTRVLKKNTWTFRKGNQFLLRFKTQRQSSFIPQDMGFSKAQSATVFMHPRQLMSA